MDVPTEELRDELDLSNYSRDHPLYNNTNKSVVGKFKDEVAGKIISVSYIIKHIFEFLIDSVDDESFLHFRNLLV